jgi:hypothetical protein
MSAGGWRVATRRKGYGGFDWDIGQTPMTEAVARVAAREFNRKFKGYEHRAVQVTGGKK